MSIDNEGNLICGGCGLRMHQHSITVPHLIWPQDGKLVCPAFKYKPEDAIGRATVGLACKFCGRKETTIQQPCELNGEQKLFNQCTHCSRLEVVDSPTLDSIN